jgi:hypothetical protein
MTLRFWDDELCRQGARDLFMFKAVHSGHAHMPGLKPSVTTTEMCTNSLTTFVTHFNPGLKRNP